MSESACSLKLYGAPKFGGHSIIIDENCHQSGKHGKVVLFSFSQRLWNNADVMAIANANVESSAENVELNRPP